MVTQPINDIVPFIQYDAAAGADTFDYPWWIREASDLQVYIDDLLTVDYTVSGEQQTDGGQIVLDTPLAADATVTIASDFPLSRLSGFATSGSLRANALNLELSYLVACILQLDRDQKRSLKMAITSQMNPDNFVAPEAENEKCLVWDGNSGAIKNGPTIDNIENAQEYANAAEESALSAAEQAAATIAIPTNATITPADQEAVRTLGQLLGDELKPENFSGGIDEAVPAAISTGKTIRLSGGQTYTLAGATFTGNVSVVGNGTIYLSGDVTIKGNVLFDGVKFTSDPASPKTLTVTGTLATDVTVTVNSGVTITAFDRSFTYTSISGTGSISAKDWVIIDGHLKDAWTTVSGRTVTTGGMFEVYAHNTGTKALSFYDSLPWDLNTETVDSVSYPLTCAKVTPIQANFLNCTAYAVNVTAAYVYDSTLDIRELESDTTGSTITLNYPVNCRGNLASRARNSVSDHHSVKFYRPVNCNFDVQTSAVQGRLSVNSKAIRIEGWSGGKLRAFQSSTNWIETIGDCVCGFDYEIVGTHGGAGKDDAGTTTINRHDSVQFNFGRGIKVKVTSIEQDATALEFYSSFDFDADVFVVKKKAGRENPGDSLVTIKAASQRWHVRLSGIMRNCPNQYGINVQQSDHPSYGDADGGVIDIDNFDTDGTAVILTSDVSTAFTSITQSAGTATAVVADTTGFVTGDTVAIIGWDQDEYNGRKTITVVDGTHVTFSVPTDTVSPGTGSPLFMRRVLTTDVSIHAKRIKAANCVYVDYAVDGLKLTADVLECNTDAASPTHCVISRGDNAIIDVKKFMGTNGGTIRPISFDGAGTIASCGYADGGGVCIINQLPRRNMDNYRPSNFKNMFGSANKVQLSGGLSGSGAEFFTAPAGGPLMAAGIPKAGLWAKGDRVTNNAVSGGGVLEWVCTTAGYACTTAWATSTAYTEGNFVYANSKVYRCVVAGTSHSSGTGPSHSSGYATETSGTCRWVYVAALAVFTAHNL